jgi:thioesterase domain-containing protein
MEAHLHRYIPLSASIGVKVVELELGPDRVVLEAPLSPNLNHRETAFGGSVAAVAILAGWTLVHARLRAEGLPGHIVIQESSVRYERPIHGAFRAVCDGVDDQQWSRLVRALTRRGKGRIKADVRLTVDGEPVGTFHGTYVALSH